MPTRSATPPPPVDRRAKRRADILHKATRLFAQHGYSDCDMDRVAAALKIAKGTLYLYFPGKRELFFACVDLGMQELQQALDEAIVGIDDPFPRIVRSIWAFLQFFDHNPQHIELLIQERAIFRDRKRPTFFEYRAARRERWQHVYRDLVRSGRLRDDVPIEQMMETVGNMLYGTMFTNYFEGRSVPLCRQFSAVVEVIFRGILSPTERDRLEQQMLAEWV